MSLETTSDDPKTNQKPKRRNSRGGNALVDEALAAAEEGETVIPQGETPSVEDEAVLAAQRNFVAPVADPQEDQEPAAEPPEPPPEGVEPYNPFQRHAAVPPAPTRKVAREDAAADRARANKGTPSTKKLGELGKKLPGAERVKVHKRLDTGALAFIGEYTESDLTQSQDMESFLNKYIKPAYKAGEYQITGVDAYGRSFDMGYITLLAPEAPAPETVLHQPDNTLGTVTRTLLEKALAPQPQPRVVDPIQQLAQLHELSEKFMPKKEESKDNSVALALISGLSSIAAAIVPILAQPKPTDPLTALLLQKLAEPPPRSAPMAPPPPPPPLPDPTEQLKNLAEVMRSMRPETPATVGDDRLISYLMQERMTPADVLKLVNEVKGERGTDDFKKSMENIGIMLNAVNQLRAHTEPSGGTGFWEALASMAQNRELGTLALEAIRSKRQPEAPQQPQQQQPKALPPLAPDDPLVIQAREQAQRRLNIEKAELEARERALQNGGTPAVVTPAPTAAPGAVAAPAATKQPDLPPNIADHINALIEAEDDAALVNETIDMLFSFMESPDWKKFAEVVFDHINKGEKKEFLHRMAQTFMGLQTLGLIELKLGQKVMKALSENFNTVSEVLKAQLEAAANGEGDEEDDEEEDDDENNVVKLGNEEPLPIP